MVTSKAASRATILIVDDENDIRNSLKEILEKRFDVLCAANGAQAIDLSVRFIPALILLDIYMPDSSGISVCNNLRSNHATSNIPIIMMTAMDGKETRINSFNSGADDFLAKPFDVDELLSRVNAKIRRSQDQLRNSEAGSLKVANLFMDPLGAKVRIAGRQVELGFIEFKVLWALASKQGKLVTRTELEEIVWGENLPATRSLDSHIATLRKKISGGELTLRAVYGEGYILD